MKHLQLLILGIALVATTACKNNDKKTDMEGEAVETPTPPEPPTPPAIESKTLTIDLLPKSDSNVSGTVTFNQKGDEVYMVANMTGLTEGTHAIHIHQTADCSSPDGKSAGGHWNPTAQPHGKWGDAEGYHKGDIGNFEVGSDGVGSISMNTAEWCMGCGDDTKDIMGKAIIVHQGADDFTSQPSGAAGARVSCAGIIE
ncbi:superoxide dismutase family protein [Winogradskyella aurantia]|uniref:Superoxide dismutase n=1 Tax=Winogradskyella aurantia TaxID=1915063 RepID=A0A265URU9_9FLAO|nr:superoxide dismutase family protein [Winogradskyella aurantia]OZV68024.1 superoxide dismutase [Winogradskyella aurantia]